jgi:hypothetical protein
MDQESIRMGARADIHREGKMKMKIKLSQSDWQKIGIKMGWMKTSGYGYNSYNIMGYTWDADEYSVRETKRAIKAGILKITDPEARLDEHGIPESGVEDREGNEIHPVFVDDTL